jgi:hypothetical protein
MCTAAQVCAALFLRHASDRKGEPMTVNAMGLSDLRGMSPEERERRIASFIAERGEPANGEAKFLEDRIREFEVRYEMSSATMVERIRSHAMPETADICKWLMLIDAQSALVKPPK